MEFLCPNGHRIRCQAEHAGRAARCPRCGVRFRVPDAADLATLDSAGSESGISRPEFPESDISGKKAPAASGAAAQDMATWFARLWKIRPDGTTIELRLRDGETIVPNQFLEKLSKQSRQGVFATTEADGTTTLTTVAWDAVARVSLRGLKELPEELTE
jgi:hypothetical protein